MLNCPGISAVRLAHLLHHCALCIGQSTQHQCFHCATWSFIQLIPCKIRIVTCSCMFEFWFWGCDLIHLTLSISSPSLVLLLKFNGFLKVISSLPPSCLPRSPTAVGSWGCQCTCILLPVLAEEVGLEEFTGLVACASRRNSALHHHVQMYRGCGLLCPWGIVGSGTLCSRPAPVITVLLSADSFCRDKWKTSWVANLDSSLWAS